MKHRLTDHSGFLEIDHTDSPGLSESEIPARLRESTIVVPKNTKFETDVQQCSHCQRTIVLNPLRVRPRAYCSNCDHYICDSCEVLRIKVGCIPFKKTLDSLSEGG